MKKALLAAAGVVALCGCVINIEHGGPVEHATKSVDLDKSEMARVEIKMGAGELQLEGGSPKLMDADFAYNIPSWKPEVHYESSGFRGQLTIEQPHGVSMRSNVTYKWNIHLNDQLPMDVVTHLGAGEARLDLGAVNLRSLEVHMGVGELRLDLRGKPTRDYSVQVHGGVGHATIYLPDDVGVEAEASGGIGHIEMRGLEKHDEVWINPAHRHAPVTIHLNVSGGVGDISVIAE
jgi:hypothetical protein